MFLSQCVEPFSFLASECLHAGVWVCAAHLSVSCGGVRAHTPANLIYSVTIFNRIHLSRVTPNSYHLFWYYLTYMYCNNTAIKFNHLFIMLTVAYCYSGWSITTLIKYYKLTRGHYCKLSTPNRESSFVIKLSICSSIKKHLHICVQSEHFCRMN